MEQNVALEIKVIKNFVINAKQSRCIQFVSSPPKRNKFIQELIHGNFLNWELFEKLGGGNEEQMILAALEKNKMNCTTCYVISENSALDTQTMEIRKAIGEIVGFGGWGSASILVFGDAEMVFFESEAIRLRYISKRLL